VSLVLGKDWDRVLWGALLFAVAVPLGLLAGYDPRIAIALSAASAYVVIAFEDLGAGLAVFGFLGFVEVLPTLSPVLSVTKLAGALLALSWFALITTRRGEVDFISVHPYMSAAVGAFVGWALLSMVWAEDPNLALGSAGRYALNAILFVIVFTAVRRERDVGKVLLGFAIGASVAAAYGLIAPTGEEEAGRLGTSILDPNDLAAVLVSGAALCAGAASLYKQPLIRFLAVSVGCFCVAAVWLTASRGGLIALGVMMLCSILVARRWRVQMALLAIVFAAGSYVYFSAFAPDNIRDRITEPAQGQARLQEGRTTIWQVAWRAFEANPVGGVGGGNFEISSKHYLLEPGTLARSDQIIDQPKVVHNTFLGVLAEYGAVGFGLFMTVIAFSMVSLLRASHIFAKIGERPMETATLCVFIALVGLMAAGFFISGEYSKQLWLLLGLGPALYSIAVAKRGGEPA
jgi:O-antigen ligase